MLPDYAFQGINKAGDRKLPSGQYEYLFTDIPRWYMQNETFIHIFDNPGECFNTINELLQNLKSIAMVRCNITAICVFVWGVEVVLGYTLPGCRYFGGKT
jgi:hypothetical protein